MEDLKGFCGIVSECPDARTLQFKSAANTHTPGPTGGKSPRAAGKTERNAVISTSKLLKKTTHHMQ